MITNYYTLRALLGEWGQDLTGAVLGDAFSQSRGELTLAFGAPEGEWMVRVSVRAPFHYVFRSEGYSRPRRNVATLFGEALGRKVTQVWMPERDRLLYFGLEGGLRVQVVPFGPRANVFLVASDGAVVEAFQSGATLAGEPAPEPGPAPAVDSLEAFEGRWRNDRKTVEQAITSALPLFDRILAREVISRTGVRVARPADCTPADRASLFEAALQLRQELEDPAPRIYWRGRFPDSFSLVALHAESDLREETFETVDAGVAVFVRRSLALEHFRRVYGPLEKALTAARDHNATRAGQMLEELSRESRADRYERWGHLLMASAAGKGPGRDRITLPDLFDGGGTVDVPLDPALTAIENATRYYDRARRTRQARTRAEERLIETEQNAQKAEMLTKRLRKIDNMAELERFKRDEASALAGTVGRQAEGEEQVPFRRYSLEAGYEVWVGRNARQNDLLTFHYAQKYDLWMHARGVPGSHTVLRLPNRNARPGKHLLEQAASIAAYHSKARGSGLVPVIVTERKYVRKPKGAEPGTVVVEREDVLIVQPRLPDTRTSNSD